MTETALAISSEWAHFAIKAGLTPKNMNEFQIMAIIAYGRELGLHPLQALASMSLRDGRFIMEVRLQHALAAKHGLIIEEIKETETTTTITVVRCSNRATRSFSIENAQRAGLIRPGSAWEKYPRDMLYARALGRCLRAVAPDIVLGLLTPEEAAELEADTTKTPQTQVLESKSEDSQGLAEPIPTSWEGTDGFEDEGALSPEDNAAAIAEAPPLPIKHEFHGDKIADARIKFLLSRLNLDWRIRGEAARGWIRDNLQLQGEFCLHSIVKDLDKWMLINHILETTDVERRGD